MPNREFRSLCVLVLCVASGTGLRSGVPGECPDFFSEETARWSELARRPTVPTRVAAARALGSLGHLAVEEPLLALLNDTSELVRREAAFGLGRSGGRRAVEALVKVLDDDDPWVRSHAALSLVRLTGWTTEAPCRESRTAWEELRRERSGEDRERALIERLRVKPGRTSLLRELRLLGGSATEEALLALGAEGGLGHDELPEFFSALERVGGPRSIELLAKGVPWYPAAAWALGNIGGKAAEEALLQGLQRSGGRDLAILINLDRLHSRSGHLFAAQLLDTFGLVSFRTRPDDLHLDPTPRQEVATRLLVRSGKAGEIVELLLAKLEQTPPPPLEVLAPEMRPVLQVLERMDDELRAGFHRADGHSFAQPLAALPHLVRKPELAPRLTRLLDHPALVVRVYAGMALGRLRVDEGPRVIAKILREGYRFRDSTHMASGKHGPEVSRFVRWKGYLAMALGRDASDSARRTLEDLVVDSSTPRDIRFGAAVGLRWIADCRSKPALEQVRCDDLVRWIRQEATDAIEVIELVEAGGGAATRLRGPKSKAE